MNILRVLLGNLLIFATLVGVVELVLGDLFENRLRIRNFTCSDPITHHQYCPEIVHRRFMAAADGGGLVDTFVDRSSIAVAGKQQMSTVADLSAYELVNLGDSFMQADELPFEKRLSALLHTRNVNAVSVGYSSWAPVNMLNWLRANPLAQDAHVNLFMMTNDFLPSYGSSNLNYYRKARLTEDGSLIFTDLQPKQEVDHSLTSILTTRSFFGSRIHQYWISRSSEAAPAAQALIRDLGFASLVTDCNRLGDFRNEHPQSSELLIDYLTFATASFCWPPEHHEAVTSVLGDIQQIKQHLSESGQSLTVYLIPAGWAFRGETLIGKGGQHYRMHPDMTITQAGLANELAGRLKQIEFVDLEPIIRQAKAPDEQWYFPVDGHWNATAHHELASILEGRFLGRTTPSL